MIFTVDIHHFSDWRKHARHFLENKISPEKILWHSIDQPQHDLFDQLSTPIDDAARTKILIPKSFIELADIVSCHRDPLRWQLLYQAAWRIINGDKSLLKDHSDPLTQKLNIYRKQVTRDTHKMKAFVRFQRYSASDEEEIFIAWHQPDHHITRRIAPFFQKRFSTMNWTIMTPDETISWDQTTLTFGKGVAKKINNTDQVEDLWCTYYKSTFNPARLKLKAMKNEMPVRYWHTMPETKLIPELIKATPARVGKMLDDMPEKISAKDFFPAQCDLDTLKAAALNCKACHLHECAKQTVFGVGPSHADIMFIGEQPGMQEDIQGKPFVGPAGQLLDDIMHSLNFPIENIYVTNVVKHFKFEIIRGQKIHRSPNQLEVNACKDWVLEEIKLINPKIIVCLGNTAAKGLMKANFTMGHFRGQLLNIGKYPAIGTYHPSAILRQDHEKRDDLYALLKADIEMAIKFVSAES